MLPRSSHRLAVAAAQNRCRFQTHAVTKPRPHPMPRERESGLDIHVATHCSSPIPHRRGDRFGG